MKRISFDLETAWIKPGMIAPAPVCMSWHDGERSGLVGRLDAINLVRGWLRDGDVRLGGHNVVFDLGVLCADDSTLVPLVFAALDAGRLWCTKVYQQLIDIARGELASQDDDGTGATNFRHRPSGETLKSELSLQALVLWWFEEHLEKDDTWRLHYWELKDIPISDWPEDARDYALNDALWAWRVHEAQENYCAAKPDELPYGLCNTVEQMQAAWSLHLMSMWGMRTDAEATAELRAVLEAEQAAAFEHLKGTGIYVPKKKREPDGEQKKCMAVIYDKLLKAFEALGLDCPMTNGGNDKVDDAGNVTRKGRPPVPQTDKETLLLSGDPDLRVLANSMQGAKVLSTYVPVLERGTKVPICAAYNVLVDTGRTSCRNPNMQNPPRK